MSRRWQQVVALAVVSAAAAEAQVSFGVNRVLQVGAVGTAMENCQALRDTLASITDSSSSNRYLVRLEPGSYECGNLTAVVVPVGVTLEGSGRELTTIAGGIDQVETGVVHMSDDTTLRSLRVNNFNTNPIFNAIAVSAWKFGGGLNGVLLDRVTLEANLGGGVDAGSALLAIDAGITVYSSDFLSQIAITAGNLSLRFSTLQPVFDGAGPKQCHSCTQFNGIVLTTSCSIP